MEAGVQQDGELLPKHFWNLAFLTNWTGGTLKLYFRRLRELFGDLPRNIPTNNLGLAFSIDNNSTKTRLNLPLLTF